MPVDGPWLLPLGSGEVTFVTAQTGSRGELIKRCFVTCKQYNEKTFAPHHTQCGRKRRLDGRKKTTG